MIFSERLKEAMEDRGVSQTVLSKRLGLSQAAISFLVAGKREPSIEVLVKACRTLNVSADWLMGLESQAIDGKTAAFLDRWNTITDDDRGLVIEIIKAMAKRRVSANTITDFRR